LIDGVPNKEKRNTVKKLIIVELRNIRITYENNGRAGG